MSSCFNSAYRKNRQDALQKKEEFVLDLETKAGRHKTMTTPDPDNDDDVTKKARTRRKEKRTKQKLKLKQGHRKKSKEKRHPARPHPNPKPQTERESEEDSRQLWVKYGGDGSSGRRQGDGAGRTGLISKTQTTMMTMPAKCIINKRAKLWVRTLLIFI